jgi:hypothetical protein
MKTITAHIRDHVFTPAELLPDIDVLVARQFNQKFVDAMKRRMVMGAFRYGLVGTQKSLSIDYLRSAQRKLDAYVSDGNTEHLIDAANYMMLEHRFSRHPSKHFKAVDDGIHAEQRGR